MISSTLTARPAPLLHPAPRRRPVPALAARLLDDPRHYQIAVLASLLLYGLVRLDLEVRPVQAAVMAVVALATQAVGARWVARLPAAAWHDVRSACISALSLCLLLRTNRLAWAAAAAALAIGSKFVLRVRGKHIFNPTNIGIVALLLATGGGVWVSPGQWGNAAFFGFLLLCLGGLVVNRAARADVTCAFAGAYASILLGRALWLGQPLAIPLHQMANGAFLIFCFFMISDPRTTPDSRAGRILFAILVALGAAWVQLALYRPTGLLLALACLAPLVPVIDLMLPGSAHRWPRQPQVPALVPERSFS
jgi:Na+-transporting NADH:ubiquinone oxidoreductase subunit NqrB